MGTAVPMLVLVLALLSRASGLLRSPLAPPSRLAAARAPSPRLVLNDGTHRKHAMEKKPAEEAEAARIARAAEEQRSLAQAEKRGIIREHIVNGRRREALRVLRDMERAQLLPDRKAYAEALIAFTTRPVQHKLVVGLAQLQERVPAPLWPGAASHFLVSAAALGDWREALTWWRKESAGSPSWCGAPCGSESIPPSSCSRMGTWAA